MGVLHVSRPEDYGGHSTSYCIKACVTRNVPAEHVRGNSISCTASCKAQDSRVVRISGIGVVPEFGKVDSRMLPNPGIAGFTQYSAQVVLNGSHRPVREESNSAFDFT